MPVFDEFAIYFVIIIVFDGKFTTNNQNDYYSC